MSLVSTWRNVDVSPAIWLAILLAASLICIAFAYSLGPGVAIDVGGGRDAPFVSGFNSSESLSPAVTFRSSASEARISFWGLGNAEGELVLTVAGNGAGAEQSSVRVLGNGVLLATIQPTGEFSRYAFPITRDVIGMGGDLIVTIVTEPPGQQGDGPQAGVRVDSASFHFQGLPILPAGRSLYLAASAALIFWLVRTWRGNSLVAAVVSELFILASGMCLLAFRMETAWLSESLFWLLLVLGTGGWIIGRRRSSPLVSI